MRTETGENPQRSLVRKLIRISRHSRLMNSIFLVPSYIAYSGKIFVSLIFGLLHFPIILDEAFEFFVRVTSSVIRGLDSENAIVHILLSPGGWYVWPLQIFRQNPVESGQISPTEIRRK